MLKRKVITIPFIVILALGACKPQSSPATQEASTPENTESPQAASSPESTTSTLMATLSEIVGKVDVKHADQDSFVKASADAVLEAKGQIQTGDDGRVRLDLSSGTIIRVAPSSLFTLTSNEEVEGGLATRIKLELGKIFIILSGGNAQVETTSGVASVRGSYLSVEILDGMIKLTCLEGDCAAGDVHFTNGQSILLLPPVDGSFTQPEIGKMSLEDFQDWLNFNPEAKELVDQALGGQGGGGSPNACFSLIGPAAGDTLPFQGQVNFEWETQPGAHQYLITFKDANGNMISFETTETSLQKYIEIMPGAGEYSWEVTAYGEDGSLICTTEPQTFSKPDSNWEPDPKEEEEPEPEPEVPEPMPTDPPMCTQC